MGSNAIQTTDIQPPNQPANIHATKAILILTFNEDSEISTGGKENENYKTGKERHMQT